jgi:hypothetical protein
VIQWKYLSFNYLSSILYPKRSLLWFSGQRSWLLTQMSWIRFSALSNFLPINGSVTRFT